MMVMLRGVSLSIADAVFVESEDCDNAFLRIAEYAIMLAVILWR